jgi:hypothetical protein
MLTALTRQMDIRNNEFNRRQAEQEEVTRYACSAKSRKYKLTVNKCRSGGTFAAFNFVQ